MIILALKGRCQDPYINMLTQRAVMCKILRCTPSELDAEDYEDIEVIDFVIKIIGEQNPFWVI